MDIPPKRVRLIIAQNSYRMANRLKLMLMLAEYQQFNIFEVIEVNQLLQTLRDASPIHVAIVAPTLLSQLESEPQHDISWEQFPDVAVLLLEDEEEGGWQGKGKILPDDTLMPPITAETLGKGIEAVLARREKRARANMYIAQGEAAMKEGLAMQARASFAEAIAVDARDPYACYVLGDLFGEMGHGDQALSAYRHGWKRKPSCAVGLKRIVDLLLAQGKGMEVLPYLETARQRGTAPIEGLVLLGTLYLEQGLLEQASTTIRSASSMNAKQAISLLLEQAHAMLQRQKITEAIDLLQIGRDIQPENAQLYGLLGDLFMQQEQPREALSCYEIHLRLGQPDAASYCRLAQTYRALGYTLRAEKALTEALNIDPDFDEATQLHNAV